ncbi:phytanoyl-CoA dioxygenase family protein [Sphingobium estronivorans]|uniref:phytanoyl-CoA dioxygenase family protein n=1 Tax=Sphingobium estronivorans TaxID=1577690 RepID=UPI00123A733B|nr:phytanoyl-CoA dioxygenase family protein [Sphingobium estronivorans]
MSAIKASADTPAVAAFTQTLDRAGYCVIRSALPAATIEALNGDLDLHFSSTPFSDGHFYGHRTKRFGGLLARSAHAAALVLHPLILALAERTLGPWCERIALNLTQAVEIHPGARAQFPHRDQDMWGGPKGQVEYLVNVMWPLTPFTARNGATRVWPCSHRVAPSSLLAEDNALSIEIAPGDAFVFLGSTLHGGGANMTDTPRRGIIISYCLGWLKPFELQWLVYPPHVARTFDPELAALVGYAQHRPNLGNYEGQCPSVLLRDEVPAQLAATDSLRPDQAEALAAFVAGRGPD